MDALEALMTTRAMRRFTTDDVSDEMVATCLRAAQQAPSGGNVQALQYVVVRAPEVKAAVAAAYLAAWDRYERVLGAPPSFRTPDDEASWRRTKAASDHLAHHLDDVPIIVLFLLPVIPWTPSDDEGPIDIGPLYASAYPAVQNFCVAARALGLGTTVTTVIRCETEAVRDAVGFPEGWEIVALVPVGRPSGRFGLARRKPVEALTHWDRWGQKRR
jgi:nitroreductase